MKDGGVHKVEGSIEAVMKELDPEENLQVRLTTKLF